MVATLGQTLAQPRAVSPLPTHLERQIEDLDLAIQVELEQRDPRFVEIANPSL